MKDKTLFENITDQIENEKTPTDIKKNADTLDYIHSENKYNKPGRENKTWCSYMENGFRASRVISSEVSDTSVAVSTNFAEK